MANGEWVKKKIPVVSNSASSDQIFDINRFKRDFE